MESMDDNKLGKIIRNVRVFARVTGEHKARIVNVLKKQGYIVAMTGDGVNDAIALKDAHVGVALGSGTDVAKEAADIVITDDNFTSIVDAVEEGRHSASNLRKVIKYLFSTNVIEVLFLLTIMFSPFWAGTLLPLALLPIQILYVNLITDGVCDVTLATERKDRSLMNKKPGYFSGSLFHREVIKFIAVSSLVVLPLLLMVYLYYLNSGVSIEHMRTAVFTLLALFQFWAAMNARTMVESIFKVGFFSNRYLTAAIIISLIVQIAVIYLPELNAIMKTAPLALFDWIFIICTSSILFVVFEGLKLLERKGYPVLS
jgi:Ca2+-transporting ATPase